MKGMPALICCFAFLVGCGGHRLAQQNFQMNEATSIDTEEHVQESRRDSVCICGDENSSREMSCSCMVYRGNSASADFVHGITIFIREDRMYILSPEYFTRIVFDNCLGRESVFTEHQLNRNRHRISGSDNMCEEFHMVTGDGRRTRDFSMDFAEPPSPPQDQETPAVRISGHLGSS